MNIFSGSADHSIETVMKGLSRFFEPATSELEFLKDWSGRRQTAADNADA